MGGVFLYTKTMITAFVILIITTIVSQYIMLGAIKQLSDEDRVKLMSNRQINRAQRRFVILMAIIAVYYVALTSLPDEYAIYLLVAFLVFLAADRIYIITTTKKKIAAIDLPDFYLKKYTLSSIISSIGLILFFVLLLKDLF